MISSRILARISESMMCPETSTTSLTLMGLRNYSGSAGRSRLVERNLVDPDGGDRLQAAPAGAPHAAYDDLGGTGGGGGPRGAGEGGRPRAHAHREQHQPRGWG